MNPLLEQPDNEMFLGGELSDEELKEIAGGVTGTEVETSVGGLSSDFKINIPHP